MSRFVMTMRLAVLLLLLSPAIRAESFGSLELLDQPRFLSLAENLAAATHYKAIAPAEPLGILGFDVGVELSSTEIDEGLFDDASDGNFDAGSLLLPRLHAHKGLPFGLDIGASIAEIPDSDVSLIAAEIRYSFIKGNIALPAVAVRASYSQLGGLDDLDLSSAALELTVSKGILLFTPYAGVGIVRSTAKANEAENLAEEEFDQNKLFVGLNVNIGFNLAFEADRTGEFTTYSAKAGVRF